MHSSGLCCLFSIILLSNIQVVTGETEVTNVATLVGGRISFQCFKINSNDGILWKMYSIEEPQREVDVFNGHYLLLNQSKGGRSAMNRTSPGQYDLQLNMVTVEDAGTYQCVKSMDEKYSAELIVFASDPECLVKQNVTNDTIHVTDVLQIVCTVEFRGNWPPSITWGTNDGKVLTPELTTPTISNLSIQTITSILVLPASSIESGVRISCVTSFKRETFPQMLARNGTKMATNVPDYSHTWTSPTIALILQSDTPSTPSTPTNLVVILSISAAVGFVIALQFCITLVIIKRKKRGQSAGNTRMSRTNAPAMISINMDLTTLSKTLEKRYSTVDSGDHIYEHETFGSWIKSVKEGT